MWPPPPPSPSPTSPLGRPPPTPHITNPAATASASAFVAEGNIYIKPGDTFLRFTVPLKLPGGVLYGCFVERRNILHGESLVTVWASARRGSLPIGQISRSVQDPSRGHGGRFSITMRGRDEKFFVRWPCSQRGVLCGPQVLPQLCSWRAGQCDLCVNSFSSVFSLCFVKVICSKVALAFWEGTPDVRVRSVSGWAFPVSTRAKQRVRKVYVKGET